MSVLVGKELLESWRTMRLPIVGGLFLLVGLTSPLLARFLPEIITAAAGDQLPAIPIPPPVAADATNQLWKNLGQFGAFAAIVLAMGSVAGERDRGTAAFVLSKSVSRPAFLGAKVMGLGMVLASASRSRPRSGGSTRRSCSSHSPSPVGSRSRSSPGSVLPHGRPSRSSPRRSRDRRPRLPGSASEH